MAEDRQIDAISIGIGAVVNLDSLNASLRAAQARLDAFQFRLPKKELSVTVKLNQTVAEKSIAALLKDRVVKVTAKVTPATESLDGLKGDIEGKISPANVVLTWSWGPDGPPPTSFEATVTPGTGGGGTAGGEGGRGSRATTPPPRKPSGGAEKPATPEPTATAAPEPEPTPPAEPVVAAIPTPPVLTRKPTRGKATTFVTTAEAPAAPKAPPVVAPVSLAPTEQPAARMEGRLVGKQQTPATEQLVRAGVHRAMQTGNLGDLMALVGPLGANFKGAGDLSELVLAARPGSPLENMTIDGVSAVDLINEVMRHEKGPLLASLTKYGGVSRAGEETPYDPERGYQFTGKRPAAGTVESITAGLQPERTAGLRPRKLTRSGEPVTSTIYSRATRFFGKVGKGQLPPNVTQRVANQFIGITRELLDRMRFANPKQYAKATAVRRKSVRATDDPFFKAFVGLQGIERQSQNIIGGGPRSYIGKVGAKTPESLEDVTKGAARGNKAPADFIEDLRRRQNRLVRDVQTQREAQRGTLVGDAFARDLGFTTKSEALQAITDQLAVAENPELGLEPIRRSMGGTVKGYHMGGRMRRAGGGQVHPALRKSIVSDLQQERGYKQALAEVTEAEPDFTVAAYRRHQIASKMKFATHEVHPDYGTMHTPEQHKTSFENIFGVHDPEPYPNIPWLNLEKKPKLLREGGPNTRKLDPFDLDFDKRGMGGRIKHRAAGGPVKHVQDTLEALTERAQEQTGRIHHTQKWRKLSIEQRTRQPFCTYCGTLGTKANPLQGEHFRPVAKGGAPFEKHNITTACKACNLHKALSTQWLPPGRAEGGSVADKKPSWDRKPWDARAREDDELDAWREKMVQPRHLADIHKDVFPRHSVPARAEGGPLMARLAAARSKRDLEGTYLVNERREEAFIGNSGMVEHIKGGPQLYQPPEDGKIIPYVPAWIQRLDKNARDLTRRATGGGAAEYQGRLGAEPDSGLRGQKRYRDAFPGERRAIAAGQLSPAGGIQRVFVINLGELRGANLGVAGAPITPTTIARSILPSIPLVARPRAAVVSAMAGQPLVFASDEKAAKALEKMGTPMGKAMAKEIRQSGGAGAPPAERPTAEGGEGPKPKITLSPVQKERLIQEAEDTVRSQRIQQVAVRAGFAERIAGLPLRAVGPAAGQSLAAGTRGEVIATQRLGQLFVQESSAVLGRREKYLQAIGEETQLAVEATHAGFPEIAEAHTQAAAKFGQAADLADEKSRNLLETSTALEKKVGTLGQRFSVFGKNIGGIIGGTLVFGGALTAVQSGMEQIIKVANPLIDRMTNFAAINVRVTQGLAEQVAQVGTLQVALAQTGRQAGITGGNLDFLQTTVGPAVYAKAGAAAAQQASDLFLAAAGRATPTGLTGGFGGVFGGPILGQPGLLETIAGTQAKLAGQPGEAGVPGAVVQTTQTALDQAGKGLGFLGRTSEAISKTVANIFGANAQVPNPFVEVVPVTGEQTQQREEQQHAQIDAQKELVDYVNEAIGRGRQVTGQGPGAREVQVGIGSKEAKQVLATPGLDDYVLQLAKAGIVFKDSAGTVITSEKDVIAATNDLARGLTIPAKEVFAATQALQLTAGQQVTAEQARIQRETLIPGAFGAQYLANPLVPAMTGIPAGGKFLSGTPGTGATQSIQNQLFRDAQAAIAKTVTFITDEAGAAAGVDYQSAMKDVQAYGQTIAGLTAQIANQEASVSAAQYANSLRLINRSISDARALVSGRGPTTGPNANLGAIEHAEFALQRLIQGLQLMLAQRQLNFQVAIAGFQAPGITGQERAARIKEAKIEASYGQRELDAQKRLFALALASFTTSAHRNVTDLLRQRGLLVLTFSLERSRIATEHRISAIALKQAQAEQKAQAILNQATANFSAKVSAAANYTAQYGGELADAIKALAAAIKSLRASSGTAGGTAPTGGPGGSTSGRASGIVFDTSGTTSMTVGEAGREHVAVIRNPRTQTLSTAKYATMAGGGTGATINLGGINISVTGGGGDQAHMEHVARHAADIAVKEIGRKARLLGLRIT